MKFFGWRLYRKWYVFVKDSENRTQVQMFLSRTYAIAFMDTMRQDTDWTVANTLRSQWHLARGTQLRWRGKLRMHPVDGTNALRA